MGRLRWRASVGAVVAVAALTAVRAEAASVYTGSGFDTCRAPSSAALTAWLASPYRAVGIYIGGVNRACPDGNLSAGWVTNAEAGGWNLLPLYVGPQAPCVSRAGLVLIDAPSATAEGVAAADDAAARAALFGLPAGSPLYFDMEGYATNDPTCTLAVQEFVTGWVGELHVRGFVAGVYGSAASTIRDLASLAATSPAAAPDAVWIAHWNGQASVFGDPYVPDGLWADHQRLHQHSGAHPETYGGVTLTIDSDYVDGPVVPTTATAQPQTPTPPAPPPASSPTTVPAGSVASADGHASVSWPAGAFPSPATVGLTTATPAQQVAGFGPAGYAVQLMVTDAATSTPMAAFTSPLTLRIGPPTSPLVPLYSADGTTWRLLPRLAGTSHPAGSGYTAAADGSLTIETRQPGIFGLFPDITPPSQPTAITGRFSHGTLVLDWKPARDNSGIVASYEITLDNEPLLTRPATGTTASVRSFHPHAATGYRVIALDPAGNASAPSVPLVVVPSARPAGLPRPIPNWAWNLYAWQQAGRAGPRPQAPSPTPAWYWNWAAWRAQPFTIQN